MPWQSLLLACRTGLGSLAVPFGLLGLGGWFSVYLSTRSKIMLCLTMSFRYAATPAERMNINPTNMHSLELLLLALDLRSTNRESVFPEG